MKEYIRVLFKYLLVVITLVGCAYSDGDKKFLSIHKLLDEPKEFDGSVVSLRGELEWHSDEPVIFSLEGKRRGILLEFPNDADYSKFDGKIFEVTGVVVALPEGYSKSVFLRIGGGASIRK